MSQYLPQIILLCLNVLMAGVAMAQHGDPQGKVDGKVAVVRAIILQLILWWGGWYASRS